MLSGDNGILTQAGNAKMQTNIAGEKEILQTASLAAISKEKYGDLTKNKLDDELNYYSEIESTEQTDNGIVVTFKSNRAYLVSFNGNVSSYYEITVGNLVVKDGNTILEENCKSVQLGKSLTINFDASIANGQITNITPAISYTTAGEKNKTFTIVAKTSEGQEITKEYTVDLKGYYNIPSLKVGDFVNYTLKTPTQAEIDQLNNDIATYSGAADNTTKTATGDSLLCRVLEIDTEGNPTKLISANGVNVLKLEMANGYSNAVYLINEMCTTLYSGNNGTTKSLTIEDLEKKYFSDVAKTIRNTYTPPSNGVKYGETKYYTDRYAKYPNIAPEEENMGIATALVNEKNTIRIGGLGLSEQTTTYTGSGDANASAVASTKKGITVTQTYYQISRVDSNYKNSTLSNIFHYCPAKNGSSSSGINSYWIASRCVDTGSPSRCQFSVRVGESSGIIKENLMDSYRGYKSGNSYAIRPIITLNSEIHAEYEEAYNSTYNTFTLY